MNSGIYQIQNIFNSKKYIGSSYNLSQRKTEHFRKLKLSCHENGHLQNAWNKYGENAFVFEIIEYCDPDQLLIREQWYLDNWNPEYNIYKTAYSGAGYKHTDESKEKMRKNAKPVWKDKLGSLHPAFGKPSWLLGAFGEKHPRSKPVIAINIQTGVSTIFGSLSDASKKLKIRRSDISSCLTHKQKTAGGYKWEYYN